MLFLRPYAARQFPYVDIACAAAYVYSHTISLFFSLILATAPKCSAYHRGLDQMTE